LVLRQRPRDRNAELEAFPKIFKVAMPGIYLEPIGFIYGAIANEAIALGGALPLAGSDGIAFGAVRLWEGEPGRVKHAVVRTTTIQAIEEPRVRELLDRIIAPRPAIAGVSMDRPRIMGIVNITPDSFSDGGETLETTAALERARAFAGSGASFVDLGGESTRPGSDPSSLDDELRRVLPVLRGLSEFQLPISVDTRKPDVMKGAVEAGASLINDVSALTFDPQSLDTAVALGKPVVLMHCQGDPKTMQDEPVYRDVVMEVYDFLESRIAAAEQAGLPRANLLADPGIGFGKTLDHNLALLRSLSLFHGLGVPLLVGTSRKGFLGTLTGVRDPKERLPESITAVLAAANQGAQVLRVHDVEPTRRALDVWSALKGK
jgi:dihydropteroate synthase